MYFYSFTKVGLPLLVKTICNLLSLCVASRVLRFQIHIFILLTEIHQITYTRWHRSPGPSGPPGTYGPSKPPLSPDIKSAKIHQIFQTSWTSNTTLIGESRGVKAAYHMPIIINHGLYIFYPIFHCASRAVSMKDNLCSKQENFSKQNLKYSDLKARKG